MSEVYKQFRDSEKKITTYPAHKLWSIGKADIGDYEIKEFVGTFISGTFNPTDTLQGDAVTEATTTDGKYKKLIFDSMAHLYYDGDDNPYDTFCNDNPHSQIREIHGDIRVISIPSNIFGEKIKPGSVTITSGSNILYDDTQGNLYDSTDLTGSYCIGQEYSKFYLGFWDGYRNDPDKEIDRVELRYEGKDYIEPIAYKAKFEASQHGRGIHLNGTASYQPTHSLTIPHDNSVIELENSKTWDFSDDFAIAFWVKAPLSQSVTQSYGGSFSGPAKGMQSRSLVHHNKNVITSKTEWWGSNWPFEISIYNSKGAASTGKIHAQRRSKGGEAEFNPLVSTTAINDNAWHHVLYQKTGSTLELYVDGTKEANTTDTAHNYNIRTDKCNVHIGGRKYHYKVRYWSREKNRWLYEKKNKNIIYPFSGSLDEYRIFDSALNAHQINCLSASINNTNRVGNVLYDHGFITITTPSASNTQKSHYHNLVDYDLQFRGTHLIKEHLYICNVLDGEFNSTYNITAREKYDTKNDNLQGFTTHSEFNPYVTTVGLFDKQNNLVALGKLAQPVKNPEDYDLSIQVRFDTTI